MGVVPIPPPISWPAGDLKVFFSGIRAAQLGPAPGTMFWGNGYYTVYLQPIPPNYQYRSPPGSDPDCWVSLSEPSSHVFLFSAAEGTVFSSWDFPPWRQWFENKNIWSGHHWHRGQCFVTSSGTFPPTPVMNITDLSTMINLVTPMIDPDPRMECFPMEDEHIAVRYAGKRDATNIMIKFDTAY